MFRLVRWILLGVSLVSLSWEVAPREDFLALGWVGGAGDSITSQFPNARRLTFKIAIEPVVQKTLKLGKDVHTDIFLVHVDDNDLAFSRSARRAACSGPRLAQLAAGSNVCFNTKSTQISRASSPPFLRPHSFSENLPITFFFKANLLSRRSFLVRKVVFIVRTNLMESCSFLRT